TVPPKFRGEQSPNFGRCVTDTPALRNAGGAFFTPTEMCQFIANWALRTPTDHVLEPSASEASFLIAAAERCHAYRRKWKSDRSHHPIKAVADASGWKDIGTMLKLLRHFG